jgi:hypothetical protein
LLTSGAALWPAAITGIVAKDWTFFAGKPFTADSGSSISRETRKAADRRGPGSTFSEVLASALAGFRVAVEPKGRYS